MPVFNAPLTDMRFLLKEVFSAPALWARLPALAQQIDEATADAILEEAAKITGDLIAPLNRSGDEEGAQWREGQVQTPTGLPPMRKAAGLGSVAIRNLVAWGCQKCWRCVSRKCSMAPTAASRCTRH